mmetsp:Transcript_39003/g.79828  ORF Transcript_39003/g.79828 Transcript_39003/m.79828 type:complete len:566 (+) Transcript_39003:4097-5794(+)
MMLYFRESLCSTKRASILKQTLVHSLTTTLFQLAKEVFATLHFVAMMLLFKLEIPTAPAIFYPLLGPEELGLEAPRRVMKMLDIFPSMARAFSRVGCTPLHVACHPLLNGDPDCVHKLLEIFPEAVRVQDKTGQESIPLHRVVSHTCFGLGEPESILQLSEMKGKPLPNNGFVYTADNTSICTIVEALVRADPSTPAILGRCKDRSSRDESEDKSNKAELFLNPIQQLWHHYENSFIGKKEIQKVRDNPKTFLDSLNNDGVCDERFGGMVVVWRAMGIMIRALYAFFDDEAKDDGSEPLIHACIGIGDHCSSSFLQFLLELDPDQASRLDERGNLPLHVAAKTNQFTSSVSKAATIEWLIKLHKNGPSTRNRDGRLPLTQGILYCDNDGSWAEPLLIDLEEQDVRTGLKPFMHAASCESKASLDTAYTVLRGNPNVIQHCSSSAGDGYERQSSPIVEIKSLLGRREEPIKMLDKVVTETIRNRFREVLSYGLYLDDIHPFSESFSPSETRIQSIKSWCEEFNMLLNFVPGDAVLPFDVIGSMALDEDAIDDREISLAIDDYTNLN